MCVTRIFKGKNNKKATYTYSQKDRIEISIIHKGVRRPGEFDTLMIQRQKKERQMKAVSILVNVLVQIDDWQDLRWIAKRQNLL